MKNLSLRFSGLFLAVFLLAACYSVGQTVDLSSQREDVVPGRSVSLSLSKTPTVGDSDFAIASGFLDRGLKERLLEEGVFASIENGAGSADYELDLSVYEMRYVGSGSRAFFMIFAPRSFLRIAVKLRDTATGKLIQSYQVTGQGARNPWSPQGYNLDDPVRVAIEEIVPLLQNKDPSADPSTDPSADPEENPEIEVEDETEA